MAAPRWKKGKLLEGNKRQEGDRQVLAVSGSERVNSDTHFDGGGREGAVGGREGGTEGVAKGETESSHQVMGRAREGRQAELEGSLVGGRSRWSRSPPWQRIRYDCSEHQCSASASLHRAL